MASDFQRPMSWMVLMSMLAVSMAVAPPAVPVNSLVVGNHAFESKYQVVIPNSNIHTIITGSLPHNLLICQVSNPKYPLL